MENEEGEYEPIDDSAPKPFSTRSLATIFTVVAVTSVGVFCALFFTIGGMSSSSTSNIPSLVDNHHIVDDPLGCTTIPSTSTGMQCAFYNASSSWLCLDQDEPSLLMDMSFLTQLGNVEDSLSAVAKDETKDTMLCSASGTMWVCVFLSSLEAVGSEVTSSFNANDLLCTRTLHADWMCWKADQDITFSNMATLSSTLLPTYRADHTIGCLLKDDAWECGELYNCIYQRKLGWACWGGNVTTTTISSVPWFTETREKLLHAELTHRESLNVTEQICYYHPKQGRYRCASEDDETALLEAAAFNGSLKSTFQCAYTAGEWLCLRDLSIHDIGTLQTFQSCVVTTVASEPIGSDDNEASLVLAEDLQSDQHSPVTANVRKTPSDMAAAVESSSAVEDGDNKPDMPYSIVDTSETTAATEAPAAAESKKQPHKDKGKDKGWKKQDQRRRLRQGKALESELRMKTSGASTKKWKQAARNTRQLASAHDTEISVRCTKLPLEWACSFISFSEY